MDRYTNYGSGPVSPSPGKTAVALIGSLHNRLAIYEYILSVSGGTLTDSFLTWQINEVNLGAGSATLNPNGTGTPIDFGGGVTPPWAKLYQTFTVEPVRNGTFDLFSVHLRATYRWTARPRDELLLPAVAGDGIGFLPYNPTYTGTAAVTVRWME